MKIQINMQKLGVLIIKMLVYLVIIIVVKFHRDGPAAYY